MKSRLDAAQAGAFMGALFGGVSLMLVGDVSTFSLDTNEETQIGEALAQCLDTLPTPIGETISMVGPWSKLASTLGGAVLKRMAMVAAAKAAAQAAMPRGPRGVAPTVPPSPSPTVDVTGPGRYEVYAPTPAG